MISLLLASCTVCVRSQGGALAGPIADTMWTRVAMRVAHDVPLAHFDAQCTSVRPGGCVRVVCACLRVRPGRSLVSKIILRDDPILITLMCDEIRGVVSSCVVLVSNCVSPGVFFSENQCRNVITVLAIPRSEQSRIHAGCKERESALYGPTRCKAFGARLLIRHAQVLRGEVIRPTRVVPGWHV